MLTVLSAGLPVSAKDILADAMNQVFGDAVKIQELTRENIRSRVRLSTKNVEVVLVVLDRVSSDLCSDIENGLYNTDKYFTYTTDKDFAEFLNSKYELEIVVEDEIEDIIISEENDGNAKDFESRLRFKDDIIFNLEVRIRDILSFYDEEDSDLISIEDLEGNNTSLNAELLDLKSQLGVSESELSDLRIKLSDKDRVVKEVEAKLSKLSSRYDSLLTELNELKIAHSKQAGVLHSKDIKIEELQGVIDKLQKDLNKVDGLLKTISDYKSVIASKDKEIGDLKVDLESKNRDLERNSKELEGLKSLQGVGDALKQANDTIESLKSEFSELSEENSKLKKDVVDAETSITSFKSDKDTYIKTIEELEKENKELSERVKSDSSSLAQLNKEKLELQSKVSILEKSNSSSESDKDLVAEVQELQNKVLDLSNNVFTKIGMSALPNSSVGCKVLNGKGMFNNIRFAFAGSAESRKGSYRCLLDEFRSDTGDTKYLIVDLVSETSIDYVFEVKKVVPGIEWFRKGGSVSQFLSDTALRNTKVLSAGIGYVNDSYFLCIDWSKRLVELENSGYKVILFCGDVSNIIGRVLHESFASYGDSVIYVSGNSIGSRTIITNLRGLSNGRNSLIVYYDFNSAMKRFYDIVSKTNECKILQDRSMVRR